MGARAHQVRSELELGRLLERTGQAPRGRALVEGALASARELGMNGLPA
jgi:hypothetical protein